MKHKDENKVLEVFDNNQDATPKKVSATQITITGEMLVAIAVLFGSVIISLTIFFSFRNIGSSAGSNTQAKTDTTTTTTQEQAKAPENPTVGIDQVKSIFKSKGIIFGDENKKLLFVEFSDPSCPYCHIAGGKNSALNKQVGQQFMLKADGGTYVAPVPEMKKLVDEGKASFAWVYSNGHGNGEIATEALYCAYEKGKFWEAHDLLMSSTGYSLINDTVKNDRTKSGDMATFLSSAVDKSFMKECLESKKYNGKIAENQSLAQSLGVNGTPGFFINNKSYAGAYGFTDMESFVQSELSK
jgi:protein-disulfide isomerase